MTPGEAAETLRASGPFGAKTPASSSTTSPRRTRPESRVTASSRVPWLVDLLGTSRDPAGRPERVERTDGFERWDGGGALGYLTLAAICDALVADPPDARASRRRRVVLSDRRARLMGATPRRRGPRGGGHRDLARARLPHPEGGPPLTGTNPIAIAVPSSDGRPFVADVSMGAVTHGDVLLGRARARGARPVRRRAGAQGVRARGRRRAARRRARRGRARRCRRWPPVRTRPCPRLPRARGRPSAAGRPHGGGIIDAWATLTTSRSGRSRFAPPGWTTVPRWRVRSRLWGRSGTGSRRSHRSMSIAARSVRPRFDERRGRRGGGRWRDDRSTAPPSASGRSECWSPAIGAGAASDRRSWRRRSPGPVTTGSTSCR